MLQLHFTCTLNGILAHHPILNDNFPLYSHPTQELCLMSQVTAKVSFSSSSQEKGSWADHVLFWNKNGKIKRMNTLIPQIQSVVTPKCH